MHYLFLDTNIFIHFTDFQEIDWSSVTAAPGKIVIVIAPIVMDELDKHKYNKNKKISRRVRTLLPKIEKAVDDTHSLKYELLYLDKRPAANVFEDNNLVQSQADDHLLATILEFRKQNPEHQVTYITHDVGPRLKARSLQIQTLKLPEKYLLPNEPDESEQEILSLQKELHALKNREPKVDLTFITGNKLMVFKREKPEYDKASFVKKALEKAKSETPYLDHIDPEANIDDSYFHNVLDNPLFRLSETQIDSYNEDVQKYYEDYESYAEKLFEVYYFKSHSIKIELHLINNGTAPANDIDVELHFPDGFDLCTKKGLPKAGDKPAPPYRPKHRMDLNLGFSSIFPPKISQQSKDPGATDLYQPSIKRTNSYDVRYHFQTLKQTQHVTLEPLYAKFGDIQTAKGFSIEYKLVVANLASPVSGRLHVKFEA